MDILFRTAVGGASGDFDKAVVAAVVGSVSMWASALVAYIILSSKKLKGHYNKLIAYLCILNLMSAYSLFLYAGKLQDTICYFGIARLYKWSLSWPWPISTLDAVKHLTFANQYSYDLF